MNQIQSHDLSARPYRLAELGDLSRSMTPLALDPEVASRIKKGEDFLRDRLAAGDLIYGVNTGFGSLDARRIDMDQLGQLQKNHLLSHACSVGSPVTEEVSRLTMLVKLLTLRSGMTGIPLVVVERLIEFWNHAIVPVIPLKGTVGASGDLAPLAHLALPLLGLGNVWYQGTIRPAAPVVEALGWRPIELQPKTGLALTNGTQFIQACAVHCLLRARELVQCAELIAALGIQGFACSRKFYDPLFAKTHCQPERQKVCSNLGILLAGSNHFELPESPPSNQDPYSFRCLPQVHGAVRQAVEFAGQVVEQECNSVSDNPLFLPDDGAILFGGNVHGAPTAMALDFLAIALTDLSSMSERRIYQLLSGQRGLPDYLAVTPGLHSGLMMTQVTAAALVNQNKILSNPASVDTIPTCQLQEDHVSMGGGAAWKLFQVLDNLEYILGVELMAAAQAVHFHAQLRLSGPTRQLLDEFRQEVLFAAEDRLMSADIEKARELVRIRGRNWVSRHNLA